MGDPAGSPICYVSVHRGVYEALKAGQKGIRLGESLFVISFNTCTSRFHDYAILLGLGFHSFIFIPSCIFFKKY